MDKELVIFYMKRHALVIGGLLLALGFVGYGVKFSGEAKARIGEADTAFTEAKGRRDNIFNPPVYKVDDENITRFQDETSKLGNLITSAEVIIANEQELVPFTDSIKFTAHMGNVIKQLNMKAKERGVKLPKDPDNTSDVKFSYYFTFFEVITKKHGVPESKMDELHVQLEDVETIVSILLNSRIQSIEMFQRNRVTKEDLAARSAKDYVDDRKKYQNSVAVIRPYRIRFRCLSGGIANVLSGLAKEKLFHVVRKVEVSQASSSSAAGGMGGMGDPGAMGGAGGFGEGGEGGLEGGLEGGPGGGPGGGRGGGIGGPGGGLEGGPGGGFGAAGGPGGEGMGGPGGAQASAGSTSIPLTAAEHQLLEVAIGLATPKAKNVMREKLLEVTIDLDVIRKIPTEPTRDGANNANPAGAAQPAGQPQGLTVPANPAPGTTTPAPGTTTPAPGTTTPVPGGTPQPEN